MTTCVCVKGMCVYPHGSGMDSGVSLNRTQQKKGNLVHRRRQGGILLGTHGQDGVQEKNATTQIGPKRQEKHRQNHSKKYALTDECITKFGEEKKPQQTRKKPNNTT